MGNPFQDQIDDEFRGRRVRVQSPTGVYEGWLQIRGYNDRAALLFDAERDGEHVGTVVVNEITAYERVGGDGPTVERVAVESIVPSPYSQRTFETANFRQYVREIRERGHLTSFPVVRPRADGQFELVSGHRRFEAARSAGLEAVPVRIVEMDDWEATVAFVDEHVPSGERELRNAPDTYSEWYPPEKLEALMDRLREDWSEQQLRQHRTIDWYLDQDVLEDDEGDDTDEAEGEESEADDANGESESDEAGEEQAGSDE